MQADFLDKPRTFRVKGVDIHDQGKIRLEPQEMLTIQTVSERECDITATSWGFYLGPSLNSRLKRQGFKTALVANESNQLFVNAVEVDKMEEFHAYLAANQSQLICWLDEWLAKD